MRALCFVALGIFVCAVTELVLPDTLIRDVCKTNYNTIRFISMAEASPSFSGRYTIKIINNSPNIERSPVRSYDFKMFTLDSVVGRDISISNHRRPWSYDVVAPLYRVVMDTKFTPSKIRIDGGIYNPANTSCRNISCICDTCFGDYRKLKGIFNTDTVDSKEGALHGLHRVRLASQMLCLFKCGIGTIPSRFGIVLGDGEGSLFVLNSLSCAQPHQRSENPQACGNSNYATGSNKKIPSIGSQFRRVIDEFPIDFGFFLVLLSFILGGIAGYLFYYERLIIATTVIGGGLLLLGLLCLLPP